MNDSNQEVLLKLAEVYMDLFNHDGYAEMSVDIKVIKRDKKEVIVKCGREFRYVIDWEQTSNGNGSLQPTSPTRVLS